MLLMTGGQLKSVADAVEAAYPEEACGLLVGRAGPLGRWRVTRIEPSANVAKQRRRTFEVDPGLLIGLERELRGGREAVIGHYHSHPDGPARPSPRDLARVFEPALVWLICAVREGQAVQMRAWLPRQDGSGFEPMPIETIDEAAKEPARARRRAGKK